MSGGASLVDPFAVPQTNRGRHPMSFRGIEARGGKSSRKSAIQGRRLRVFGLEPIKDADGNVI